MFNLLAADLYRITRPRGLRGTFWQYGIALAVVYAVVFGFVWFSGSDLLADLAGFSAEERAAAAIESAAWLRFETPTAMLASFLGGIVPLCVGFMTVEHAFADFKEGFARSIVSARRGRLSYFAEKIVFTGIMALAFTLFAALMVALAAVPAGTTVERADGVLPALGWFAAFILNTWAIATAGLVVAYLFRKVPAGYIAAFLFEVGFVPGAVQLLAGLARSGLLRVLAPIAPVLDEIAYRMPSHLLDILGGGASALSGAALGGLGEYVPGGFATQALVDPLVWITLGALVIFAASRRRDI